MRSRHVRRNVDHNASNRHNAAGSSSHVQLKSLTHVWQVSLVITLSMPIPSQLDMHLPPFHTIYQSSYTASQPSHAARD
jgi:hypothetical protein